MYKQFLRAVKQAPVPKEGKMVRVKKLAAEVRGLQELTELLMEVTSFFSSVSVTEEEVALIRLWLHTPDDHQSKSPFWTFVRERFWNWTNEGESAEGRGDLQIVQRSKKAGGLQIRLITATSAREIRISLSWRGFNVEVDFGELGSIEAAQQVIERLPEGLELAVDFVDADDDDPYGMRALIKVQTLSFWAKSAAKSKLAAQDASDVLRWTEEFWSALRGSGDVQQMFWSARRAGEAAGESIQAASKAKTAALPAFLLKSATEYATLAAQDAASAGMAVAEAMASATVPIQSEIED